MAQPGIVGSIRVQEIPAENARAGQAASLRDRLRFAGIEAAQGETLRNHRQTLERHVETALRDLFQRFQTFPDAARHFQSERQIDRLHDLQSSHWSVLTDARFDGLYAERVKVLADSESQMGLDPRWRIAGHSVVVETVVTGLIEEYWPKSILPGGKARRKELTDLVSAFLRTAMVDAVKEQAAQAGVKAKAVIARSDLVAESIMAAVRKHKCDLVVMASHGRKGIKRLLLGSETQHVLTHSTVPVLVPARFATSAMRKDLKPISDTTSQAAARICSLRSASTLALAMTAPLVV